MYESILVHQARQNPAAIAIVTANGTVTFERLEADVRRVSAALREVKGLKGRVAVQVASLGLHWLVVMALTRLGHVSVSLPAAGSGDDAALIRIIQPDFLLADTDVAFEGVRVVHLTPDWIEGTLAREPETRPAVALGPDRPMRIVLSSGTSGPPKMMALTRGQLDQRLTHLSVFGYFGPSALILGVGIDNYFGYLMTLQRWAMGERVVHPAPGFDWATTIDAHDAALIMLAPVQLDLLLRGLPDSFAPRPNLYVGVAGSGLSNDLAQRARARLTPHIQMSYGTTEAGWLATAPATLTDRADGVAGFVNPWVQLDIVDADRTPVANGVAGEIRVRSPEVLAGYLNGPAIKDADGWLYTGDAGSLSDDGVLVVEGRIDDVIVYGQDRIAPLAIETVVLACAGVGDAAAFPMPTSSGLSLPFVAVTMGQGFDPVVVKAALERNWPGVPIQVAPVTEIPRNARGKIARTVLRDRIIIGISEMRRAG